MAESTANKSTGTAKPKDAEKTNPGTASPEAFKSADVTVAEAAGISEGDVKALRDDAGLNLSAGHDMDIHAWQATPAGKEFAKGEKDRQSEAKAEEKKYGESTNKDGLNESEAKYVEAVNKA